MIKIAIIGSGNVAQHLISAFLESDKIELVGAFARHKKSLEQFSNRIAITDRLTNLPEADMYIVAVSDAAIAEVSSELAFENRLVVHTSGSISMAALSSKNRKGVIYPLQTFSKNKSVDFKNIPICIESDAAEDLNLIEKVAQSISNSVYKINSKQRKALHVAAVFANNFTNHLYTIASDICSENNMPFEILKPLIRETAEKITMLSPVDAQTGPARREDFNTIKSHLEFLSDDNQKNIYTMLTQSIQQHGEKL